MIPKENRKTYLAITGRDSTFGSRFCIIYSSFYMLSLIDGEPPLNNSLKSEEFHRARYHSSRRTLDTLTREKCESKFPGPSNGIVN